MESETLQRIRAIKSRRSTRLPKGRSLTMEESSALMSCHRGVSPVVDTRDKALLALMLGCGLRRAEVCGLTLSDVNFDEGAITLIGKGNKERKVYLPEAAMNFLPCLAGFPRTGGRTAFHENLPGRAHSEAKEPL